MKELIEKSLASLIEASSHQQLTARPSFDPGIIPDSGALIIVSADIENRAGRVSVAETVFRIASVMPNVDIPDQDGGIIDHIEKVQSVKNIFNNFEPLDCGGGIILQGAPYYIGQSGQVEDNQWVSEIRFRFGVLETF